MKRKSKLFAILLSLLMFTISGNAYASNIQTEEAPDEVEEEISGAYLIVESYSITNERIIPGEPFELAMVIKNASTSIKAKNALVDITLVVKKGEKTAIVGKNGAGKSTLVNMILGLYDPIKGRVLYNGKEAKAIDKKDLFAGKSAVFQNVNKYKMTIAENVQLGNPQKNDLQEQIKALKESGFPLNRYSMDEELGKEFGGIDISGGEWQRLSMARGIYKNGSFVVLDEPTSAIDPLQEAELYKKFVQLFSDKTVFLVTHRLGAVSIADKIIVLDDGKIKEHGTHEELIRKNGYYKKLWDSQVKWYH